MIYTLFSKKCLSFKIIYFFKNNNYKTTLKMYTFFDIVMYVYLLELKY